MKKGLLALLLMLLLLVVTACSDDTETAQGDTNEEEKTVITVGAMSSTDAIPLVLVEKNKLDEKYNIDLNIEMFKSAKDRDAAFQAGELDGVLSDLIGVTLYQNANFDVKITGSTDGDFLLVAGKDTGITSVEDVRGKSIGISENTLIDYSLDAILHNHNMELADVVTEIVPRMPDRLEMLQQGKLDFALLPEPFSTLALNNGATELGSANENGIFPAITAFSQKAIDEKAEAIEKLFVAYNEAVQYMNETDISEYEDVVIEKAGYPEDMAGSIELPKFRENVLPPKEDIEAAIKWASERGLCSPDLTYEQMVYDVTSASK